MKILILESNPKKDLNLTKEIKDLQGMIERSRDREQFQVELGLAVNTGELQGLLLKHEPQIVHFCGHGTGEQGLVLQDEFGREQFVATDALKNFFELFSERVECVLLNACYSEVQADVIVEHINYVIGMSQAILDSAAIAFSKGFYQALGYGKTIEQAYKFGCNQIHLTVSSAGDAVHRSAVSEEERTLNVVDVIGQSVERINIPEYLKPQLKKNPRLAAGSSLIGSGSSEQLSQREQVEIQLNIDRAYDQELKLKQYREQVRVFLVDHKLTKFEEIRLEQLRKNLGLSVEEANRILAEEKQPIQQACDDYQEMLIRLIEEDHYPFDPETEAELQQYCQELRLTEEEVRAIREPILEAAEEDYQMKLQRQERQRQQEHQTKLHRYEQEFRKVIEAQYPIAASARNELKSLQQSLGLSDEDVTRIEKLIKEAVYRLKVFEFQVPVVVGNGTITYQRGQADYFVEDLGNGVTLEMVAIAGGTFSMGSPVDELERSDSETPQHSVTIQPFLIGKFAVTQAQWQVVAALPKVNRDLDPDPTRFKGRNRPVEQVNWHEAVEFCDRLSQKTGRQYRLPSEAEWEYACRAGTTTPFYGGETITTDLANYDGNYTYGSGKKGVYREQTTEVGNFPPNAFGLYDMHGNVWEWCADHWHENYQGAPVDGSAWVTGGDSNFRLLRGGSWDLIPWLCRSAYRRRSGPAYRINVIGFRVVSSAACALLYQNG